MRSFQHPETLSPVPGDVVTTLRGIDRAAGAEARNADQLPQLLDALREQARVESITASSAIEGVVVDDTRVSRLVSGAAVGQWVHILLVLAVISLILAVMRRGASAI